MAHEGGAPVLEERIHEWRSWVRRRRTIDAADVDELEDHLRSQVADLEEAGLDEEEAFLIGVKRLGELDTLSREFAREHSERLWKRLVVADAEEGGASGSREALVALGLAVAAALAVKVPELFGLRLDGSEAAASFYARNAGLLVLPFLAGFFAWKRGLDSAGLLRLAVPFLAGALALNLLPFARGGSTEVLAALHLPIALWLAVGIGYAGGAWRSHEQRMNYVRFTGEWFIYFVLIALGGGVLMMFTMFIFSAIGVDAERLLDSWILPCGAAGAVIVAGWLVEAKQSVIENMAPVLTLLFTPLFTLLLLAFLVTMAWTGTGIAVEREVLIGFDLLLVLVLGLLLYSISARDPRAEPGFFDLLQLVLVIAALLVDAMALWAIVARISAFGFSPNKVAALGENLILVANLGVSAVLYARFLRRRSGFAPLERWQTAFLPVYAVWAWIVVVIFPLVFRFR
ncbi:MAG: permease prefix domain 1-containing protein [Gemmatimonadota bacterium]